MIKTGEDFEANSGIDDRLTDGIHRDSLYGGERFFCEYMPKTKRSSVFYIDVSGSDEI